MHEHAVFAHEGHNVGDGAEGDEVEGVFEVGLDARRRKPVLLAQHPPQGDREVEGHADGAEHLAAARAVDAVRVDHRRRLWQLDGHGVVINDDDVDAALLCVDDFVVVGDAAVDGDHEPAARVVQAIDARARQPVALDEPVGDRARGTDAAVGEEVGQQCGRGDAVDVVVAEDADRLIGFDAVADTFKSGIDAGEPQRIGQVLQTRLQIVGGLRSVGDAAADEHASKGRRQLRRSGDGVDDVASDLALAPAKGGFRQGWQLRDVGAGPTHGVSLAPGSDAGGPRMRRPTATMPADAVSSRIAMCVKLARLTNNGTV